MKITKSVKKINYHIYILYLYKYERFCELCLAGLLVLYSIFLFHGVKIYIFFFSKKYNWALWGPISAYVVSYLAKEKKYNEGVYSFFFIFTGQC